MATYIHIGELDDEYTQQTYPILKLGAVRTRTYEALEYRKKNVENYISIQDTEYCFTLGESEEKSIHRILKSNTYTQIYNPDIETDDNKNLTEYYEPNDIIMNAIRFLHPWKFKMEQICSKKN